jgi:hypothetical protein
LVATTFAADIILAVIELVANYGINADWLCGIMWKKIL